METAVQSPQSQTEMSDESQFIQEQLNVVDYSDKSFVVYGELTRKYKDTLKEMGGRFNKNLTIEGKPGSGWIYSLKQKEKVMTFVLSVNSGNEDTTHGIPSISSGHSMSDIGLPTVNAPSNTSNSSYQFVRFKVYRPREMQKVRLNTSGKTMNGVVTKIESHNRDGVIDTVYIDFDGQTSMGVICRSKWQIFGYFADHSIFFTE